MGLAGLGGQKRLKIVKHPTPDASDSGAVPLLTIDVWEHVTSGLPESPCDYVAAVIDKLLNWEFASDNLPA
jgi:Fe-Mn family superoxide dismutase